AVTAGPNGHEPTLVAVGPGAPGSTGPDSHGAPDERSVAGATHRDGRSSVARELVGDAPAARKDTFGLSNREREALALIAVGRTQRDIRQQLFISQKTGGVHVGNILAKLGVSGRVEAAAVAIRL